jgi:Ser-tRNA(Ala) deacylase AlaX
MTATVELFASDAYQQECDATVLELSDGHIVLDQTVFYPEGGGQVGDSGVIGSAAISDTRRDGDSIVHITDTPAGLLLGGGAHLAIDWPRRYLVMRHHTLLHLAHIAAAGVIGYEPDVIGSQVRVEKARLDYDYHGELDVDALTAALRELITADLPVKTEPIPGAGARERQWTIPGHAPIPCGGTHVHSTGEIGEVDVKLQRKGRQGMRIYCNVRDAG